MHETLAVWFSILWFDVRGSCDVPSGQDKHSLLLLLCAWRVLDVVLTTTAVTLLISLLSLQLAAVTVADEGILTRLSTQLDNLLGHASYPSPHITTAH